jgi:hypothetical protein
MKIQDRMQQGLAATPGFALLAFGDLTSGLILNWAARTRHPREVLDRLGERAAASMALAGADWPDDLAAPGLTLVRFTETGSEIFVRPGPASEDVLCAVCAPGTALDPLIRAAADLARSLQGVP